MPTETVVKTSAGDVEIVCVDGEREPVLFFPGGHCAARADCGWYGYRAAGHEIVSFSRPGYGRTRVGALGPAEFADVVRDVCSTIGIDEIAAVVGVSFGGVQAVHVALDPGLGVPRLVLHSSAPSLLPYPDSLVQSVLGRVVFSAAFEGLVWGAIHRMVRSDRGLRRMMSTLSTRPVSEWWRTLSETDVQEARALFLTMRSDRGFGLDLRHSREGDVEKRRAALGQVSCPTLVTGTRSDGGVSFAHAVSLAEAMPHATLREFDAPSHLFWIGTARQEVAAAVKDFLDT